MSEGRGSWLKITLWSRPVAPLPWRRERGGAKRRGEGYHLINRQVAIQLPLRDVDAVVVPLLGLGLDVALEDVLAQGGLDDLIALEVLDRAAQRARQHLEAARLGVDLVEVLFDRHGRRQLAPDAVEARGQHDREG